MRTRIPDVAGERDEGLRRWAARGKDAESNVQLAGRRGGNDGVRDGIRCGRRGRAGRGDHGQVAKVTRITVRVTVGLRVGVVLVESGANRREHHEQYRSDCRDPPRRNHAPIQGGMAGRSQVRRSRPPAGGSAAGWERRSPIPSREVRSRWWYKSATGGHTAPRRRQTARGVPGRPGVAGGGAVRSLTAQLSPEIYQPEGGNVLYVFALPEED